MAKRQSLSTFSPQTQPEPAVPGGNVVQLTPEAPAAVKYPKVSVYLTAEEVRTLKLIGIDSGKRVSDICAAAVRDWLEKNGHARK